MAVPCTSDQARLFHTSHVSRVGMKKLRARAVKQKNLALQKSRQVDIKDLIDPIRGIVAPERRGFLETQAALKAERKSGGRRSLEDTSDEKPSLLKQVLLDRHEVWFAQPPQYPPQYYQDDLTSAEMEPPFPTAVQPPHYSNAFANPADQNLILTHLPNATLSAHPAAQAIRAGRLPTPEQNASYQALIATESKMSEQVQRILDLRNSDSAGIHRENTRRLVELFGGNVETDPNRPARLNTGHPAVLAAVATQRILYVMEHIRANPKDIKSKTKLKKLVHDRARALKYYKRKVSRRNGPGEAAYLELLDKLGLDPRAVEGELVIRF